MRYFVIILFHIISTMSSPNICDEDYIDAVFNENAANVHNHIETIIVLIRGNWRWKWNSITNLITNPTQISDIREETGFDILNVAEKSANCTEGDCIEIEKMRNLGFKMNYNLKEGKHDFQFYRSKTGEISQTDITDIYEMPWNMTPSGDTLEGKLWPNEWRSRADKPVIYIPERYELVFIVNGIHGSHPKLMWNNLNTSDWDNSWKSQTTDVSLTFHGIFMKNDIIYAIGDQEISAGKRVAQIFSYEQTENDGRKLVKTNLHFKALFDCPKESESSSSDSSVVIIVIVVFIGIILIISGIAYMAYVLIRSKRTTSRRSGTVSLGSSASTRTVSKETELTSIHTINSDTGITVAHDKSSIAGINSKSKSQVTK